MLQYIDSHAHLTYGEVYDTIDTVLSRAQESGIRSIINICTDPISLERGLDLSSRYPWIYNVASTTPHDVDKEGEQVFPLIVKHALQGDLIAIGETGLDYHYEHSDRKIQQDFLKRYLGLALECKLPVVIHCREAFSDLFAILDSDYQKGAPGILHCFTGTLEEAKELLERGWYISLSGIVTFKKSQTLHQVAKLLPLDRLLLETDTPYLAPQSKRGKTNEPAFLPEIAAFIAELKGVSLEAISESTCANTRQAFKFKL